MKLYYFNPNDYDVEYFVMAKSKDSAVSALVKHLKRECEKDPNDTFTEREYNFWNDYLMGNKSIRGYTIDEYGENEVIKSEIA